MHNTRLQARQKAIEDFYSGNWRHKNAVTPMTKFAQQGYTAEQQVDAAMKAESDARRQRLAQLNSNAESLISDAAAFSENLGKFLSVASISYNFF